MKLSVNSHLPRIKRSQLLALAFIYLLLFWTASDVMAKEISSGSLYQAQPKVVARLHNIELMQNVLKKGGYNGYDLIIISSTTREEAEYQQKNLERAFFGTSRKDGRFPIILSVADSTEGGQVIGAIFTWFKAEEKMRENYPDLMAPYLDLLDYVRITNSKVSIYHNGGKGERCSPLTQSLGNSRGSQKLVGSIKNACGEEIELEVLLGVILQCSDFAITNSGTHIDTFWTSQIAFGSYPHDQLIRSNFAIDKFLVGFDKDVLIAQNIADFGTAALSKTGRMMAFYGNKRFAYRKADQYIVDEEKIEKELLSKGDKFAYDFGSFTCSFDMWELFIDYWTRKKIFSNLDLQNASTKVKRDIDPHFIQPLIRFLYAMNDLVPRQKIEQSLPDPVIFTEQKRLDIARECLNKSLKETMPEAYAYIWEDIEQEENPGKKNEAIVCMNEVIEFYLLYRCTPVFKNLKEIFGFIDLGDDTQWFRYRRPIDIMNEKLEMLTDLIGKKIEVQLNGSIQSCEADENLVQRCFEARLMRRIDTDKIANFTVEGKPVTLNFSEMKEGKLIEDVYVKNSIIQNSDLTRGSSVVNSIVNNVVGKVIANSSYLESSVSPLIEADISIIHEVCDIQKIVGDREVISDVYRTKINPPYHGRMRAPIGYDPKGMPIYQSIEKNNLGILQYIEKLDETIKYFVERVPYDLKNVKEYSDGTAKTEDGLFTFEEIRKIEPIRIADKSFKDSICLRLKEMIIHLHLQ